MLLQQENEALLEDVTSRQVHQNPPGEPHDGPREAEEPAGEEVQVMLSSSRRPPVFFFSFCRRCHSPIHRLDWLGDPTLTSRPPALHARPPSPPVSTLPKTPSQPNSQLPNEMGLTAFRTGDEKKVRWDFCATTTSTTVEALHSSIACVTANWALDWARVLRLQTWSSADPFFWTF